MSDEDRKQEEKKSQALNESILFIFGCISDSIQADLKWISAYSWEKYPRDIKAACNIYRTQYSKTTKSNNSNEYNTKQDKDEDDDKKKDGFVTAHISMNSATNIVAVHALNESMWKMTDDDNIGSLVGEEDLICTHFDRLHLEESDDEYDYKYDSVESINTPMVKTVSDKHTDKFVFNDAEELFPLSPQNEPMFCPTMHPANPMLETMEVEQDTDIKHLLQNDVQ